MQSVREVSFDFILLPETLTNGFYSLWQPRKEDKGSKVMMELMDSMEDMDFWVVLEKEDQKEKPGMHESYTRLFF